MLTNSSISCSILNMPFLFSGVSRSAFGKDQDTEVNRPSRVTSWKQTLTPTSY